HDARAHEVDRDRPSALVQELLEHLALRRDADRLPLAEAHRARNAQTKAPVEPPDGTQHARRKAFGDLPELAQESFEIRAREPLLLGQEPLVESAEHLARARFAARNVARKESEHSSVEQQEGTL